MALITSKSRLKPKFSVGKRQEEEKKSRQDELDDLCVRGYACKLFRDDIRAREVHKGSHLIPWMGDNTLMIDRYDGRGHLHDLRDFEQSGWNEDNQLSKEAARIEAICDEERYMALHTDLLEEQHRHEEELKRLNEAITSDQGYNCMEFGYGAGNEDYDPMQPTEDEAESGEKKKKKLVSCDYEPTSYKEAETELEEPFIAPPELKLPSGMEQPMTLKLHVFMEKTAMFVINHGPQMEIIVKTKQANNPQFDFLQFDHFLNPYYKHILAAIKSKMYIPLMLRAPEPDKKKQGEIGSRRSSNSNSIQSDDEDDDLEGSGYLHPSLFAPPRPKPAASSVQHPPPSAPHPDNIPAQLGIQHGEPPFHMMDQQQQQQQPQQPQQLMAYYEGEPVTTRAHFHLPPMLAPPPPPLDHANSGAPVQLSHPIGQLPPPGFLPGVGEPGPLPGQVLPHHHPALSIHDSAHPLPPASMLGPPLISQELTIPHASDESAIEPQPLPIVPPPPDIQPVIDKLAKYVAKNGDEFEASVRAKCDPRFEFLVPWHSYNAYYLAKKKMFIQEFNQGVESGSGEQKNLTDKSKKVPVRFPIKPKKAEERTLERKSALPVESSSSDSDGDQENSTQTTSATNPQGQGQGRKLSMHDVQYKDMMDYDDSEQQYSGMQYGPQGAGSQYATGEGDALYPPNQEYEQDEADDRGMTEYGREHQRTGGNHQRLEDRLAMAARKKLASASQERSVQVERRKKLALFLSQVKDRPQAAAAAQEGGMSDPERSYREDSERSHLPSRRRSPVRSNRRERTASPPYTESRSSRKAPSVPKSYQTAVNREQMERERRRKRHSKSRSPSPRKMKRKSPPPLGVGTSAVTGRSSPTSSPTLEPFQDREASVSSPGSDSSSKMGSQLNTQPSGSETKADTKGGASDLRAKIRAMLAATMNMNKEDIG